MPNLGVNDVNERPSETSSGAAMFTMSTTSTMSAWVRIRRRTAFVPTPPPPRSARRVHVNDSNRQWWRRFRARREHNATSLKFVLPLSDRERQRTTPLGRLLLVLRCSSAARVVVLDRRGGHWDHRAGMSEPWVQAAIRRA
jgi:hypothetical protein